VKEQAANLATCSFGDPDVSVELEAGVETAKRAATKALARLPRARRALSLRSRLVSHVEYVVHVFHRMAARRELQVAKKQNLTVQLDTVTIRKARVLAAKRGTSVSAMVAAQIQESVEAEEAFEAARRAALEWLGRGFHLGGRRVSRDELHER
jgi:hypothetical protein